MTLDTDDHKPEPFLTPNRKLAVSAAVNERGRIDLRIGHRYLGEWEADLTFDLQRHEVREIIQILTAALTSSDSSDGA